MDMKIDIDIEKIFEDFIENSSDIAKLEKDIYLEVCKIGRDIYKKVLQDYDKEILKARDKDKYKIDGFRKTNIKTIMGDVAYKRRIYVKREDNKQKKYTFLLDTHLNRNSEKIGNISPYLANEIIESITNVSYRKVANDLGRRYPNVSISHQAVWNVVQKYCYNIKDLEDTNIKNVFKDNNKEKKKVDILFQEVDGLWIKIQGQKTKKELKLGVIYEGWKKRNKKGTEFETINKTAYSCFNTKKFWELNDVNVYGQYDIDYLKVNVLNGDGAKWIKNGVCSDVVYQIDRFHIHQAIVRAFSLKKKIMKEMFVLLKNKDIKRLIERAKIEAGKTDANSYTRDLHKYLSNNKGYLLRYNERNLSIPEPQNGVYYRNLGTMEHNICDILAQRMKNNKTSWSIDGAENMARILCQKVNN